MTMLTNMVLALIVLTLLVWLIKPSFAKRKDLLVGEGVDLTLFTEANVSGSASNGPEAASVTGEGLA
jgi:hypothetical protein